MGQWHRVKLSLLLEPLKPALELIEVFARGAQVVLSPVLTALEGALSILALVDPSAFDFAAALGLLTDLDVVHLYPEQPYKALSFRTWKEVLAFSYGSGDGADQPALCAQAPYNLITIMVSAGDFSTLQPLYRELMRLFGLTEQIFSTALDLPQTLTRPALYAKRPECQDLGELIPVIGDAAAFLSASIKIEGSGTVRMLKDLATGILQDLQDQIARVSDLLKALESISDLPEVYISAITGISSISELQGKLASLTGGPSEEELCAGTGMLTGLVGFGIVAPALGLGDEADL